MKTAKLFVLSITALSVSYCGNPAETKSKDGAKAASSAAKDAPAAEAAPVSADEARVREAIAGTLTPDDKRTAVEADKAKTDEAKIKEAFAKQGEPKDKGANLNGIAGFVRIVTWTNNCVNMHIDYLWSHGDYGYSEWGYRDVANIIWNQHKGGHTWGWLGHARWLNSVRGNCPNAFIQVIGTRTAWQFHRGTNAVYAYNMNGDMIANYHD